MLKKQVNDWVNAWQCFTHAGSTISRHSTSPLVPWVPPPTGTLKCNVDAMINDGVVGFGAVLRDHEGKFVAACGGRLNCAIDPYVAEAMAVKEALTWLKNRGTFLVIIESDCLNVCNGFNSASLDYSYVGLIIKQCKLIARDMRDIVVRHVIRSANQVAHVLARGTGSSPVLRFWDFSPPDCISSLLLV
ncbi:uncharacterized protein LOC116013195 [Ipomoea triloba]|uniref:uncharacterized protein LOC116013195 n=1 Tax=Ipomoea triloba TaxID=35885 RepID=UPI00125D63CF|nr:uncharacterized protein LOC116013195 [Ipomoea triloba]